MTDEERKNNIIQYIDDYLYYKKHRYEKGIKALKQEANGKYVTIEEVGDTILKVIDDILNYTEVNQAVNEVRIKAIVSKLPEESRRGVYEMFDEAGDDLLED